VTTRRPGSVAAARLAFNYYTPPLQFTTPYDTLSVRLTPVGCWGTLHRNFSYSGPALRVEDNGNPGTFSDVYFDATGFIRQALPYGADTRVVTLYDQFGSSDLFAVLADNIQIRKDDLTYGTWLLDFNGSGGLTSTDVTNGSQPWELGSIVWGVGHIRDTSTLLRPIWGVQSDSGFMEVGVWQEVLDLHWRVNGSSPSDWNNTDWNDNAGDVQNVFATAIGDVSNGSPATAYFNGVNAGTRAFGSPIVYSAGKPLNIGDGLISSPFSGQVSELVIFDHSAAATAGDITALHNAMSEVAYTPTVADVLASEQRAYVIMGPGPTDSIAANAQIAHVVLGGGTPDGVKVTRQNLHAVLAPKPGSVNVKDHRLHVIVVP